jgi:hypothetical protein
MFQVTTLLNEAQERKALPKPSDEDIAAAQAAKDEADAALAELKKVLFPSFPVLTRNPFAFLFHRAGSPLS